MCAAKPTSKVVSKYFFRPDGEVEIIAPSEDSEPLQSGPVRRPSVSLHRLTKRWWSIDRVPYPPPARIRRPQPIRCSRDPPFPDYEFEELPDPDDNKQEEQKQCEIIVCICCKKDDIFFLQYCRMQVRSQ